MKKDIINICSICKIPAQLHSGTPSFSLCLYCGENIIDYATTHYHWNREEKDIGVHEECAQEIKKKLNFIAKE